MSERARRGVSWCLVGCAWFFGGTALRGFYVCGVRARAFASRNWISSLLLEYGAAMSQLRAVAAAVFYRRVVLRDGCENLPS